MAHGLSLPVAVPVAAGGGLTCVSSGRFHVPAQLAVDDLIRERGQVDRGVVVPVESGAQMSPTNCRSARVSLAFTAPHAEHVLELGYHRSATTTRTPTSVALYWRGLGTTSPVDSTARDLMPRSTPMTRSLLRWAGTGPGS